MLRETRIRKLETRYRLPLSARAEQRRLDQLMMKVLDRAFTQAIQQAGLPEESEVCIRRLSAPFSLHLRETDESLIARWITVVADEIDDAIRNGSSASRASSGRVVVYHSRRQALLDLGIGVAGADLRRAWAWRQLGLWRSGNATSEDQAVSELVDSLCNETSMVVPTLRALAQSGGLQRIAVRLTEEQWRALALAALGDDTAGKLLNQTAAVPSARAVSEAWRVVNRSPLLQAVASTSWLADSSDVIRRSIAILAVLDVEPTLLQTNRASTVISIIAAVGDPRPDNLKSNLDQSTPASPIANLAGAAAEETADAAAAKPYGKTQVEPADRITQDHGHSEGITTGSADRPDDAADVVSETSAIPVESLEQLRSTRADESESVDPRISSKQDVQPVDLRQRAFTRLGGLLFLLGVVEDLNLPEQILAHPVLGARSFVWIIHQLALTLTGNEMAPNDPAALAFAGLAPQAKPPSVLEGPPNEVEVDALGELTGLIIDRLHSTLDFEEGTPASLVDFVCRRRGEIVADPGWIEVRLSLDEVSTEIRRAGLDLNPGYLPWLGVVVRFVYE